MSHEEKMAMRDHLYAHATVLMDKVRKMFESGELTPTQMAFAGDIMKDLAKMDKSLSEACYYDSASGSAADKKY